VVTENGVVYLMGLVTRQEADAATDVTRQVDGVQRVVKVFEYIDS
jgi:osmotically-inducible protein OsmY